MLYCRPFIVIIALSLFLSPYFLVAVASSPVLCRSPFIIFSSSLFSSYRFLSSSLDSLSPLFHPCSISTIVPASFRCCHFLFSIFHCRLFTNSFSSLLHRRYIFVANSFFSVLSLCALSLSAVWFPLALSKLLITFSCCRIVVAFHRVHVFVANLLPPFYGRHFLSPYLCGHLFVCIYLSLIFVKLFFSPLFCLHLYITIFPFCLFFDIFLSSFPLHHSLIAVISPWLYYYSCSTSFHLSPLFGLLLSSFFLDIFNLISVLLAFHCPALSLSSSFRFYLFCFGVFFSVPFSQFLSHHFFVTTCLSLFHYPISLSPSLFVACSPSLFLYRCFLFPGFSLLFFCLCYIFLCSFSLFLRCHFLSPLFCYFFCTPVFGGLF